jgi:hypothetical protein
LVEVVSISIRISVGFYRSKKPRCKQIRVEETEGHSRALIADS